MKSFLIFWYARVGRLIDKLRILTRDLRRSFDWHFRGGKVFFNRYGSDIKSAHKWVFIVGCNNSGTSVLQKLLGGCGDVSTLPLEGQMYTNVFPRARKRNYERVWSEYIDELMVIHNEKMTGFRLIHDWMRNLTPPIKKIILEKTTTNTIRMQWLQNNFPECYFIGLVRNGYAVSEGIRRKGQKSIERSAKHWNFVNKLMISDKNDIKNFLEIKYEDLTERPIESAQTLAAFLQIDAESMLDVMNKKQFHFKTAIGNDQSGLINMNEHSFAKLTLEDIGIIEREAGEMLNYFGYENISAGKHK